MGIPSIHVYIQLAPQGISQQRLTQYTIPTVLNPKSPLSCYLSSDYHVKYTLVADIFSLTKPSRNNSPLATLSKGSAPLIILHISLHVSHMSLHVSLISLHVSDMSLHV